MTAVTDLSRPALVSNAHHPDLRGAHRKLFGSVPEALLVPDFEVREVFMTTSHKDVIRGLHFQEGAPQAKIIKPLTGSLIVNTVCFDPSMKEFGEVTQYKISADDEVRLYVPGRYGLGYRVVEDNTNVLYIANEHFVSGGDTGVDPFDAELNVNWGENISRETAIMSPRDHELQSFAEFAGRVKN